MATYICYAFGKFACKIMIQTLALLFLTSNSSYCDVWKIQIEMNAPYFILISRISVFHYAIHHITLTIL
ncbi:hypothetical protein NQ317_004335 [Molorchus minor]|uniref:Secreted protein n=1 Tax=Molorchus minor TaxID=1323400 RepID=A0ABQ9IW05_9CUCU|nr:hypothetical protein NQ317_004335 [Molorchus minor]